MQDKALTLIVTQNAEISPNYLRYYLGALNRWNLESMDQVQVVILSQLRSSQPVHYIASHYPFAIDIVHAYHDFVDGYPIWDLMDSIRAIRSSIRGKYISFHHTEFIWYPDAVTGTIAWLKMLKPYIALGNMRRPGYLKELAPHISCSKGHSDRITKFMEKDDWDDAGKMLFEVPTTPWVYWLPEFAPGKVKWLEDVFFADMDWLDSWNWLDHGGKQPFQDIWDLLGGAMQILEQNRLHPQVYRMPRTVCSFMHLWHRKMWGSWTPAVRDWCLSKDEYKDTTLHDQRLWEMLVQVGTSETGYNERPIIDTRRGPKGTVTRYTSDLRQHLNNGGKPKMEEFYSLYGRQTRVDQGQQCLT